jgi:hypothetical protein
VFISGSVFFGCGSAAPGASVSIRDSVGLGSSGLGLRLTEAISRVPDSWKSEV